MHTSSFFGGMLCINMHTHTHTQETILLSALNSCSFQTSMVKEAICVGTHGLHSIDGDVVLQC
jgi:hypothetical protein